MANEAQIVELFNGGRPIDFTVEDTNAYSKGQILWYEDARKISGASTIPMPIAGIATADKEASDGATNLSVYTDGIFKLTAVPAIGGEGAITAGCKVVLSGANTIRKAQTDEVSISGATLGVAYEDIAAATTGEVRVNL